MSANLMNYWLIIPYLILVSYQTTKRILFYGCLSIETIRLIHLQRAQRLRCLKHACIICAGLIIIHIRTYYQKGKKHWKRGWTDATKSSGNETNTCLRLTYDKSLISWNILEMTYTNLIPTSFPGLPPFLISGRRSKRQKPWGLC